MTTSSQKMDPIRRLWDIPVLFHMIHLSPHSSDPDPTGEALQVKRLEVIMQAIDKRAWIAGMLSWSYVW